jgi:hypothetical protein
VCDPETLAEVKQELVRAFQLLSNQAAMGQEQRIEQLCEPWRKDATASRPMAAKQNATGDGPPQ